MQHLRSSPRYTFLEIIFFLNSKHAKKDTVLVSRNIITLLYKQYIAFIYTLRLLHLDYKKQI